MSLFKPSSFVVLGLLMALSSYSNAANINYTYDSLGRLTKIVYSTGVTITYTYDASGNRTQTVTTGAP